MVVVSAGHRVLKSDYVTVSWDARSQPTTSKGGDLLFHFEGEAIAYNVSRDRGCKPITCVQSVQ